MILITYEAVIDDRKQKGYSLNNSVYEFIMTTQEYSEVYFILHTLELTDLQAKYIADNDIKGM